jgi:hypothetical protein
MKSKNPKNIKKGMCILIATIVLITTIVYAISGYKTNKLAIVKANGRDALAEMNITEVKNNASLANTFITNNSATINSEKDIRYVKLTFNR